MLAATFVLALSSVVFKFFAVRDDFWTTTFWTFVGEGLFGAAILARAALPPPIRRPVPPQSRRGDRRQCRQ